MKNNKIPKETEDLLCDICKKYPENNCSKCNKIKLAFKAGQKQEREKVLKEISELGYNLISRMCRPNKQVDTFENAREQEEIIYEEFEDLKSKLSQKEGDKK